jgi:5-methylcytosine-specific restriction enzyme A
MSNSAYHYLYGRSWQRARLVHLRKHPLCTFCLDKGMTVAAHVVDHKTPHKGNTVLFWDRTNWQSLCFNCHNSDKQRQEALDANATNACSLDGYNPNSDW